jgi:hypothetical protein
MNQHDEADDFDEAPPPLEEAFCDLSAAVRQPPSWIIEDLVPPGLIFVGGPPKAFKSSFTTAIALLASGHDCKVLPPFLSRVKKDGPVLMFSYEATAGELRDMAESGLRTKVKEGAIFVADDPWDFRLDDPNGLNEFLRWCNARDPRIVILDPLRDFHQLEEKDSGGMNRLLRPIRQWAVESDSAVLVVHHTKKREDGGAGGYDNNDLRGTGALFGIADGVLMLSPTTPTGSGPKRIKATFKRAAGWERVIQLSMYDEKGPATEQLTSNDQKVLSTMKAGIKKSTLIARNTGMSLADVRQSVDKLARNGFIDRRKEKK